MTVRRTISPPSLGAEEQAKQKSSNYCQLHSGLLVRLLFDPEDRGDIFVRKVCCPSANCVALYSRRQESSSDK
jgi:hypothetical protein